MKYKVIKTLGLSIFLLVANQLLAQENYFTSFKLTKSDEISENWQSSITSHWKSFYDNRGWNRIGVDAYISREFGLWKFYGGIVTNYTFDQSIENNLEIRPWLGLGLENEFVKNLYLEQIFKFEIRNFLFNEERDEISVSRVQYRIKPYYVINSKWKIYSEFVWYFLPDDDLHIRFLGSREQVLGFSYNLPNSTIKIYYSREEYTPLEGFEVEDNANMINFVYMF